MTGVMFVIVAAGYFIAAELNDIKKEFRRFNDNCEHVNQTGD